jgi:hypothetical protein
MGLRGVMFHLHFVVAGRQQGLDRVKALMAAPPSLEAALSAVKDKMRSSNSCRLSFFVVMLCAVSLWRGLAWAVLCSHLQYVVAVKM